MQSQSFLIKIIEKHFKENLEIGGTEFYIEENDFYNIGKKIDASSTIIIDKIKDELKIDDMLIRTNKRNDSNEVILLRAKFDYVKEKFIFTLLPTKSEIINLNERETLRQKLFEREVSARILSLSDKQSVTLINDVLGFDELAWIKKFRKGKITRDGGVDFIAEICIDKNNSIEYNGYGKFFQTYGQLKHLKGKMSEPSMREFVGSMISSNSKIEFGMVISSRGFSNDCKKYVSDAILSKENKIIEIFCYDIEYIAKLMIKFKIGLNKSKTSIGLFIDEYWWDEIERNPS